MHGKDAEPQGKGVEMERRHAGRDDPRAGPAASSGPCADLSDREFMAYVTPHLPTVVRVTAALVGAADAEDAAQEAVVRAWQAVDSLRQVEALRPWLLRIAVNVCRDWRRGRFGTARRLNAALDDMTEDESLAVIAADPGTSDHTGALDMRRAVNGLDRDLRLVVALRYYAGMDATEIGVMLGVPPTTVRTRLRRALGLLRQELNAPGAGAPAGNREGGR
jgi:RNA polymerase sigma-70 factor, ECF subfamily